MDLFGWFRRKSLKERSLPSDGGIYLTDLESDQITKVPYLLAHDVPEQNRLEFQHFFLKGILRTNFLAPLNAPSAILDVGSGTGRWVVEMAQQFPQARITGVDISPTIPQAPPTVQFIQQDILKGLPFPSASFDYVHARLLVAAIPLVAWSGLIKEYARVTRLGGWMELFEGGTTFLNAGPHTQRYLAWWNQLSQQKGIDASYMDKLPELMYNLGIQNIHAKTLHVPIGNWGGRVGSMLLKNLMSGWGGLKTAFTEQIGVKADMFDRTLQSLPGEWEANHSMYEYVIVIGQVKREETGKKTAL